MAKIQPDLPPAVPPELPPSPADAASTREPKFETPKEAPVENVPRVIPAIERAPKGLKRFKIRADKSVATSTPLYILAKDIDSAKRCYMEQCPEHKREYEKDVRNWERAGEHGPAPEPPDLVVTELPD